MKYAEAGLAQLARLASMRQLITTAEVRRLFKLDAQAWHRLCTREGFPRRRREGRAQVMDPTELGRYLSKENHLHSGMTYTQAARMARHTVGTLRRMVDHRRFPAPIGHVGGRARFDKAEVQKWLDEQRHGMKLPPEVAPARGGR